MSVTIIETEPSTLSFTNSAAENTVFSATVTANTIGSSDCVVCEMLLGFIQNHDSSEIFTLRIKFGGTTYYQDGVDLPSTAGTVQMPVWFYIVLAGNNATNAQTLGGVLTVGASVAGGGATTGIGDFNVDEVEAITPMLNDAVAIDQTVDRTFEVTIQMAQATANTTINRHFGSLTAFKV